MKPSRTGFSASRHIPGGLKPADKLHNLFDEVFGLLGMSKARAVDSGGVGGERLGLGGGASPFDKLAELGFHLGQFG
jgi:hypothetical protein